MNSVLRRILPILLVIALSAGFRDYQHQEREKNRVVQRDDKTDRVRVSADDAKMNAAMETARGTIGELITAMKNPKPNQKFSVKMMIFSDTAVEHIWLTNLRYDGRNFVGKLRDSSQYVRGFQQGQKMTVAPDKISDWWMKDGDEIRGGYTLAVLRAME